MRKFRIASFVILLIIPLSLGRLQAANGPPSITSQPTNQTVVSGASAAFSVAADGTPPLSYQWQWNGSPVLGATNATLSFPSVSFTQSGAYSVTITNSLGSLTSAPAFLLVDPQLTFRVTAFRTNGAIVVDHDALTGDDRGGIAVSPSTVFITGDNATARFNSEFLTGGVSLGNGTIYDGMVTDLRTETIYVLASGTNILTSSGGTLDNLVRIDGATGALTSQRVILSTNIVLQNTGNLGLFSGYGRIVIHLGSEAYDISMPSGQVTYLGFTPFLPHNFSESWAYWGIAEYLAGNIYVLFADSANIARARLPDGAVSTAASFLNFSDMASFTISPSLSRWFFHYEGSGQLGGVSETLGSAKALYTTDPNFPSIYLDPIGQSVYPGSNVTLRVSALGGTPLYYQWRLNGTNITGATNILYTVSNADTNAEGAYSVAVSNSAGTALSADAFVTLITRPFILQSPFSILTYPGSNALFEAFADGAPPLFYQWLFNGVEISGATNSFLVLTNLQLSQEGAYSLQVSNRYDVVYSDPANLTIRGQPTILSPPVARTVNANSSTIFAVTADGAPPLHYQWLFNGTNIPNATNRTLSLSHVQPAQAGSYLVTVSNVFGTISASADLVVLTVPTIVSNPSDQSAVQGESASFRVSATGPGPLHYQWRFNGAALPNATNAVLTISSVQAADVGSYSVLVYNTYGSILSTPASLSLFPVYPEGATFRIVSLTPNNSRIIEHNAFTGDDRGGIVASLQNVFITGDNSTARFGLDLTNGLTLNQSYDSLAGNLRNGKVYLLASNDVPFFYGLQSSGVFTHLLELDTSTGLPSGNRISLTTVIPFDASGGGQCGIFSGFDRILFHNKTNVYGILLPSGVVTNYGAMVSPEHSFSESWAYWGVAENFGGNTYITYVRNSSTISRTRVPNNITSTVSSFSGLSDMASFTVALYTNRWYFHYEGSSQFGGSDENLGYATAVFDVNPVDHFEWASIPPVQTVGAPFTVTIAAKTGKNATVTTFNGAVTITGTNVTGGGNVPVLPSVTANFTNGIWTGAVSVLQPSTSMYLQASGSAGNTGISSPFTVLPTNDISFIMNDAPDPVPLSTVLTYSIIVTNTGPNVATAVLVDDVLPPNITVQSAQPSQGTCTIYTNAIICDLGNMQGRTAAAVSIAAIPNLVGKLTNQVTIYRGEADGTLANNSAVAITTVTLPQLSISDASLTEGNSGTNDMKFQVSLFPPTTNTVRVNFTMNSITALRDSDFVFRSATVTFLPGETNQTISIGIIGDTLFEPDETFSVQLFLANGGFITRGVGIGTILNDDPLPSITIPDIALVEGNSGTNASFPVILSARSGLPVTLTYATSDGTARAGLDYLGATSTLVFPAGTAVLTQAVLIPILGDAVVEPNETFFLNVLSISNAVFSQPSPMATILNDDGIGILHHFTWGPVATQQTVGVSFPVSLTAKDAVENTISNFNQAVHLEAGIGITPDPQHMIDDDTFPFTNTGDFTIGFEFTPYADITVIAVRHYVGVQVSLWSDSGELLLNVPVVSSPGTWTETALDFPIKLPGGLPYRVAFYTGNGGQYAYSTTNLPPSFADGAFGSIYYNIGNNYPSNLTSGAFFPVDLVYFPGDALQPVSITPTNTANFVNGFWSGELTILESGTGVRLFAADDAGHRGQSSAFDVLSNVPRISDVHITGNDVHVFCPGVAGTNYRLERNDTLQPNGWTTVASFSPVANQVVELIDAGGATAPSRFYRIKVGP